MPGKIKSKAQQAFLAIHKPKVLSKLTGEVLLPKGLPQHVPKRPYTTNAHVRRGQTSTKSR